MRGNATLEVIRGYFAAFSGRMFDEIQSMRQVVEDLLALFGAGFGPTNPVVPATTNPVKLTIGGTPVTPSFAGLSSAGLCQINLTIPAGLATGDHALAVTVGGVQTQSPVLISLQ